MRKRRGKNAAVFLGAFLLLSQAAITCAAMSSHRSSAGQAPEANTATEDTPSPNLKDANSVLRIAVPRTMRNRRKSMAYTYGISYRNRNFTPAGRLTTDYLAKYEVIFVGGMPYRRLVEENDKPLTPEQAEDEQKRYDRTFAERSQMTLDQKRDYLKRPWNLDVPLPQLVDFFSNTVTGEDSVNGRPAIIIESVPRTDVHPAGEEERRAMRKRVKLWVDRDDLIVSRIEATLVADEALMKKGSTAKIDFALKDGVWLPVRSDVQFQAIADGEIVRGETQEVNADFHRFRVDVRLMEPADSAGGGHQAQ